MSKGLIGGILGTVVGAGALFGVMQIPAVNNALILNKNNTQIDSTENQEKIDELEKENSSLVSTKIELENKVSDLTTELATKDEEIKSKDEKIKEKEDEIVSLNSEISKLNTELETYKGLVSDADINYIELISSLEVQLAEKTFALDIANAQLQQLQLDKTTLETRVVELENELAQVKEELANYKSFENIDTLNVSSFNGKWYKNSLFDDYYIIEDGIVTHNLNEDKGVVQNIYNQMYLIMNETGGVKVNLYDDGMKFVLEDGTTYTKYYVNTTETMVADFGIVVGDYSLSNEVISLKGDNTLTYTDGSNTYFGAYTASAVKKNVGGNITMIHYVTANINIDESTIIQRNFKIVNYSNELVDTDNNLVYVCTRSTEGIVLSSSGSSAFSINSSYCYAKVIVRTKDYITIENNNSISFMISSIGRTESLFTSTNDRLGSSNRYLYVNGLSINSYNYQTRYLSVTLYNATGVDVTTNTFELYFYLGGNNATNSNYVKSIQELLIDDIYCVGNTESTIIDVQIGDNSLSQTYLSADNFCGKAGAVFNSDKEETLYAMSDIIPEYYNGIYSNENMSLTITEDSSSLVVNEEEIIPVYEVIATTDGTKIYHTVVIAYTTSDSVTHSLVLELENMNLISSTLDEELITLTKN